MSKINRMRQSKAFLTLWSTSHFRKIGKDENGLDRFKIVPVRWTEEMVRERHSFYSPDYIEKKVEELVGETVMSWHLRGVMKKADDAVGSRKPMTMILQRQIKVLSSGRETSNLRNLLRPSNDRRGNEDNRQWIDAWVVMVPNQGLFVLSHWEVLNRTAPAVNPEEREIKYRIKKIQSRIRYRRDNIRWYQKKIDERKEKGEGPSPVWERKVRVWTQQIENLQTQVNNYQAQLEDPGSRG